MRINFKFPFFSLLFLFNIMGLGAFFFQQGSQLLIPTDINIRLYHLISSIAFSIGFILTMSCFSARKILPKLLLLLSLFLGGLSLLLFFENTTSYFYLLSNFLNPLLFPLLIWGFTNQITTFAESLKYYLPLTLLSGIAPTAFAFSNIHLGDTPIEQTRLFITGAALCVFLSWVIYKWTTAKLPEERWQENEAAAHQKSSFLPAINIGYALAALGILYSFLNLLFKTQVGNQFPTPAEYNQFMDYHAMFLGLGVLCLCFLSLLGIFVLQRKGWRFTALLGSCAVLTSLFLFITGIFINFYPLQLGTAAEIMTQGFNVGLLYPLIQMIYLSFSKGSRFKTQLWAELFIAPFFLGTAPLIIQGLLVQFGTAAAISPYLMALTLLTTALLIKAIYSLGKRKMAA